MKLLELTLNNFRQFTGEQTIQFSTDDTKKATFIFAESGLGKTTIIRAFKWVFHGTSPYETVVNGEVADSLNPGSTTVVMVSLKLEYRGAEYKITRTQQFQKLLKNLSPLEAELKIDRKDPDGITKQVKGEDAKKIVKQIMVKDLMPYFFLEGEALNDYGKDIAKGNSNAFINAIKGLLGFSHLYEAQNHLNGLIEEYRLEIQSKSKDNKLNEIISGIQRANREIENLDNDISNCNIEIDKYEELAEKENQELQKYASVADKQKRNNAITKEIEELTEKINGLKKNIFSNFSKYSFNFFMDPLISIGNETLMKENAMDKGIPGMDAKAIDFLLKRKKCICGHDIEEGSEEWVSLKKIQEFLPPNNISHEISLYKSKIKNSGVNGTKFFSDYANSVKEYTVLVDKYNNLVEEAEEIRDSILGVPNISSIKARELDYRTKLLNFTTKKARAEEAKEFYLKQRGELELQQSSYVSLDGKIDILTKYQNFTSEIFVSLQNFCNNRETIKRKELQTAINEIFKEYYKDIDVQLSLDEKYNIQLKSSDTGLLDDFVSGGQKVAVALAFIGAVVKLNSEIKDVNPNVLESVLSKEIYPLVLDAPTSTFGMKQMNSFSEITPKITNQLIVFINDKDGPILRDLMKDKIGKEYIINRVDSYHAIVREV